MNQKDALAILSLETGATAADIKTAAEAKKADIQSKITSAPTDALKAKFQQLLDKVIEAEQVCANEFAPKTKSASPLSQTKMADLPGMAPNAGTNASAQALQPGSTLLNRYEIKQLIAEGGMGAVYRAHDKNRDEDIAIKVMLPQLMQNETARERFLAEARLSSQLSHPNIVNVYDVQQEGDLCFLTMELLEGQDLRELMENRKLARQHFNLEEVQEILTPICAALDHAHEITIHRDIKPENIFLTEDGKYKLMDFGIARVMSTSQRTQTGAASGTAYYMAPEQLKGAKDIDGRADQYALAVLTYELLSGEVPAGAIEPLHELVKGINKKVSAAVQKALSPRAENRFDTLTEFLAALQGSGKGMTMPGLPIKAIGIAASVIAAIALVVVLGSSGALNNLSDLLPESAEEIAAQKADVAKLIGEIKTYKQRLENGRRQLASEVRDAERNNNKGSDHHNNKEDHHSGEAKALEYWKTLTDNYIFNGSQITDLEGDLSMGESLLRDKDFVQANMALTRVRDGYKDLWGQFNAAEGLYVAKELMDEAQLRWQKRKKAYAISDHKQIKVARQNKSSAENKQREGRFDESLVLMQTAESNWDESYKAAKIWFAAKASMDKARVRWQKLQQAYNLSEVAEAKAAHSQQAEAKTAEGNGDFVAAIAALKAAESQWQGAYRAVSAEVTAIDSERAERAKRAIAAEKERKRKVIAAEKERKRRHWAAFKTKIGKDYVAIKGGSFQMGSNSGDSDEKPVRIVTIKPFALSKYEVTQKQWRAVMGSNLSAFEGCDNCPVEYVSWDVVQEYISKLNSRTGKKFRLPTEAEWEYACRSGGKDQTYCGSSSASILGWHDDNSGNKTHPVGGKQPNGLGLYDMSGNVQEWVHDCWNESYDGAPRDGSAWLEGDCEKHVVRGGSWGSKSSKLRSANRYRFPAFERIGFNGFRLAQD